MPFLRFSRDKRGYENTYVLHAFRHGGRLRPRVLYWFRTPPNVRVGRLPLDGEAVRAIEENNPDLTFDWSKILKVRRSATPVRGSKPRRSKTLAGPASSATPPGGSVEEPPPQEVSAEGVSGLALSDEAVEAEQGTVDDDVRLHPVVTLVGDEGLARLRARYAEIQARISEKLTDPVALEAMRTRAESLNPDGWVSAERAVLGLELFERESEIIKKMLGRRRRRSRRGGRRHRRDEEAE